MCSILSFPCALFVLLTWALFKERQKQRVVLIVATTSFICATIFFFQFTFSRREDVFCSNNAAPIDKRDGVTWCSVQGACIIVL